MKDVGALKYLSPPTPPPPPTASPSASPTPATMSNAEFSLIDMMRSMAIGTKDDQPMEEEDDESQQNDNG